MGTAHGHGIGQFGLQLVHVDLHALGTAAVDHIHEGPADEHRVRAQGQGLEHIHAGADTAVHQNSHLAAHRVDDGGQDLRRGGNTATFDALNKYFTICGMPVASSQYWNMVYGNTPEEVRQDKEGLQTMRTLGRNMAFLMKSIALGKAQLGLPEKEPVQQTNFHH